ncbi:hypothetical protein WR25_09553 [Diploscapter pachys]|uniref:Phospholipid-transporting ATPase n=1 Tax=Diploscapter pachys TaxID=2018661 RepID=A0A2A2KX45_9BILA|nr:hypothetical protein WR25_09553 [Diploscapter pachys]
MLARIKQWFLYLYKYYWKYVNSNAKCSERCRFWHRKKDTVSEKESITIEVGVKKTPSNNVSTCNYSVFSFLPVFLFHQFSQFANALFLIIYLVKFIVPNPPFGSETLAPLAFIISVAAVREIYEDLCRRWRDRKVNEQKCLAFVDNEWKIIKWSNIHVGQLIKVQMNEQVPADMLILKTSEVNDVAYIETANLDGESSLKVRQAINDLNNIASEAAVENLWKKGATIVCDPPNKNLYEMDGYIEVGAQFLGTSNKIASGDKGRIPFGIGNMLMRGARLRNTQYIYGVVIYTGKQTKLLMNNIDRAIKTSHLHRVVNWSICMNSGAYFLTNVVVGFVMRVWPPRNFEILGDCLMLVNSYFYRFLECSIMLTGFIPMSLFVSIECVEVLQGLHVKRDVELMDNEGKKGCDVKAYSLISELGRVSYVMSDKTGTLTQNQMRFRKCSVGGVKYANKKSKRTMDFYARKMLEHLASNSMSNSSQIRQFFLACAVCHTVNTENVDERIEYHATSPDELAIVTFAANAGYKFHSRSMHKVLVKTGARFLEFELLAVLEFNSERKRMSAIVRDKEGQIMIYCKGADTMIMSRLATTPPKVIKRSKSHLSAFASEGYRTLCFGAREIRKSEYGSWKKRYDEAMLAQGSTKKELLNDCAEQIEKNFELIGISAIEDRLQDGVIETIEKIQMAGIRVWVLTGDKLETAMNIGSSCKLLSPKVPTLLLETQDAVSTTQKINGFVSTLGDNLSSKNLRLALIVDATSLSFVLNNEDLRFQFMRVALCCSSVICCRCTPMQKADVTDMVKQNVSGSVLAIGDGGNDRASVGVGIAGKEGMQAATSADYAVTKFKHLERLLFVHGTLSLFRTTKVVLFVLYKGLLESILHIYFIFFNGHTAQLAVDTIDSQLYSMWYCAWPCLNLGVFDRPAPVDFMIANTKLYTFYNRNINLVRIASWALSAVLHAMTINIINYLNNHLGIALDSTGRPCGLYVVGNTVYALAICVVNLKMLIETDSITYWAPVSMLLSLSLMLVMIAWNSFMTPYIRFIEPQKDLLFLQIPYMNSFCLGGLVLGLIFVIEITFKAIRRTIYRSDAELMLVQQGVRGINYDYLYKPIYKICDIVGIKTESELLKNGFAFAQDEGEFVSQQQIIEATASKREEKSKAERSDKTAEASSEQTDPVKLDGRVK